MDELAVVRKTLTALLFAALLSGCGSQFSKYERVQKVRSDFSLVWQERAARYRQQIANTANVASWAATDARKRGPAEGPDATENEKYLYLVEVRRGSLSVLEDFKKFRASEPVLTAAINWLRDRGRMHWSKLQQEGVDEKGLRSMIEDVARGAARPLTPEQSSSMWRDVGAMAEAATIHLDLVRFRHKYAQGFRQDKRDIPEAPAITNQDMNAIVNGVMAGVGAAFPR